MSRMSVGSIQFRFAILAPNANKWHKRMSQRYHSAGLVDTHLDIGDLPIDWLLAASLKRRIDF